MVSVSLATIVLALGISGLTTAAAFLGWWAWDQRRFWAVVLDEDGNTDWFKVQAKRDTVRIPVGEEDVEVKLEPDKHKHKKGWRSGRCIFVDAKAGIQVDPQAGDVDQPVGFDMARVIDAKLGETWRQNFPEETFGQLLKDFMSSWGIWILLLAAGGLAYAIMGG